MNVRYIYFEWISFTGNYKENYDENENEFFIMHYCAHVYKVIKLFDALDRKSTRLNSSHVRISYAVFCLKKKKKKKKIIKNRKIKKKNKQRKKKDKRKNTIKRNKLQRTKI